MNPLPQIYRCLDDNSIRPAMNYALIRKDDTVATDAHIMVQHASSELFDEDFLMSIPEDGLLVGKEALIDLSRKDVHSLTYVPDMKLIKVFHLPGRAGGYSRYYEIKLSDELITKFPNYDAVWPSKEKKPVAVDKIGFNPDILSRLSKSLGNHDGIKMEFYGDTHSIICRPQGGDYLFSKGLIMPVILR